MRRSQPENVEIASFFIPLENIATFQFFKKPHTRSPFSPWSPLDPCWPSNPLSPCEQNQHTDYVSEWNYLVRLVYTVESENETFHECRNTAWQGSHSHTSQRGQIVCQLACLDSHHHIWNEDNTKFTEVVICKIPASNTTDLPSVCTFQLF